jgi:hypothetical protein
VHSSIQLESYVEDKIINESMKRASKTKKSNIRKRQKLQHRIGHQHQFKANTRTRKCIFKSIAPKKGTIGIKNIVFNFAGFYIPPI